MLKQLAEKYYIDEKYNCAESLLMAANEYYHLGLSSKDAALVSGFGAGMGCGDTCGALCGALAAYGKLCVEGKAHQTPGFSKNCGDLVLKFKDQLGSTLCAELTPLYKTEKNRCLAAVLKAADVLEAHIAAMPSE